MWAIRTICIHRRNRKWASGWRCGRLGTTYGKKVVYSGPLYESMRVEGKEIRLQFEHAGMGLQAHGGALQGFSMAGADKKFHRAVARIDGNAVIVSSPEVETPVAVRYDWARQPGGKSVQQRRFARVAFSHG